MDFGSGVTCPSFRHHPSTIAQAAATQEYMTPGRFWLGLGTGELLNEHVVGTYWQEPHIRVKMLQEATEMIKKLFTGEVVKHEGVFFGMDRVRLWTVPERPPPIYIGTAGPYVAKWAGEYCDGIIVTSGSSKKLSILLESFSQGAKKTGKDAKKMMKIIQVHLSWAETDEEALQNALREWPNGGMPFPKSDIKNPEDFQSMAKLVRPEDFKGRVFISSDIEAHRKHIQEFVNMGFDRVYVHNVGKNQDEFIREFSIDNSW
ncbi:MAG: TIGR03557 family F420-dependent LLM class oxidoreductase [Candidatus Dojkabacteria bacterium]